MSNIEDVVNRLKMCKSKSQELNFWLDELRKIKDAVSSSACYSKTEMEAFINIGIMKGLDIAINLDEFYKKQNREVLNGK
jgi:hypothetical protein